MNIKKAVIKKYAGYLVKVYVGVYNYNELLRLENEEENKVRGQAGDLKNIAARKRRIMDVGFRLFCERGIESVSMKTIAEQSGVPWTSMYRYFATKLDLVITISTWTWNEYITSYVDRSDRERIQQMTAAEYLKWLLDSFLDLYRNHGDILRFNYSFNRYLRSEQATEEQKL